MTYSFIAWFSVTLFLCGCIYSLSFLVQHIWNLPLHCSQAFNPNWKVCCFLPSSKFARFVVCIPLLLVISLFMSFYSVYHIFNKSKIIQMSTKYTNVLKIMEIYYLKILFFLGWKLSIVSPNICLVNLILQYNSKYILACLTCF